MDPMKLLADQHKHVKELFEKCTKARGKSRQALFEELADELAAHTAIEERLFYPAAYVGDLKSQLEEAVEEHLAAKRLLADLLALPVDDDTFTAKLAVLQEQIEHHVEEEEKELFPAARKALKGEPLDELGDAMRELFEKELEGEPRQKIPKQTGEAASLE